MKASGEVTEDNTTNNDGKIRPIFKFMKTNCVGKGGRQLFGSSPEQTQNKRVRRHGGRLGHSPERTFPETLAS